MIRFGSLLAASSSLHGKVSLRKVLTPNCSQLLFECQFHSDDQLAPCIVAPAISVWMCVNVTYKNSPFIIYYCFTAEPCTCNNVTKRVPGVLKSDAKGSWSLPSSICDRLGLRMCCISHNSPNPRLVLTLDAIVRLLSLDLYRSTDHWFDCCYFILL